MIRDAKLTPGRNFKPVNALLYYGMRFVPNVWVRRTVAGTCATGVRLLHRTPTALTRLSEEARGHLTALRANGFCMRGPLLSSEAIAEVHSFLRGKLAFDASGRGVDPAQAPADVRMAAYPMRTILDCPHLFATINHPELLSLAWGYLGCSPTVSGVRLEWSFPAADGSTDVQKFHRDYDDWRFFKAFLYLTDVDSRSGPHECVPRSHLHSGHVKDRPYPLEEIRRTYGDDGITSVTGPRGTSFMVDTWGIHRGSVPQDRPRLLFQIQYSILPVFKWEYEPLQATGALSGDPDPYINRLLLA